MIFEQPLTLPLAIALVTTVTIMSFGYRVFIFNRQRQKYLYSSPSIVVLGHWPGKTHFVKEITKNDVLSHPSKQFKNEIGVSYLDAGNKKIQFVDPKNIFMDGELDERKVDELKKLNCRLLLYLFDASPKSKPINVQMKNFKKAVSALDGITYMPVVNTDSHDRKKMEKIRQAFKNVHEFPGCSETLLDAITSHENMQLS